MGVGFVLEEDLHTGSWVAAEHVEQQQQHISGLCVCVRFGFWNTRIIPYQMPQCLYSVCA